MKRVFIVCMLASLSLSPVNGWESDKRREKAEREAAQREWDLKERREADALRAWERRKELADTPTEAVDAKDTTKTPELSNTPTTKEEVRIMVKVLQVSAQKDTDGLFSTKGLLCSTNDGLIYVEYSGNDIADDDIIPISVQRKGVFRYVNKVGADKAIGKYEWKPKVGQKKICKDETKARQITGKVIVIYLEDDDIRIRDAVTGKRYIVKGYKDIENTLDDELLQIKAKRVGAESFANTSGDVITLPIYQCVYD